MIQSYDIEGMTCGSCEARLTDALAQVAGVTDVVISREQGKALITSQSGIKLTTAEEAIQPLGPKYTISLEGQEATDEVKATDTTTESSWLSTYKPILLIFAYLLGVTLLVQYINGGFDFYIWMRHFMAGFFLVFSFFKLLNLSGFASSYAMYDIVARRFASWGYVYPFVELGLGMMYLINFDPVITNSIALLVMSVSIIGVLQSVLDKRKIQCACLGDVFNLPMSTVTIIEDGLMILMSLGMLFRSLNI